MSVLLPIIFSQPIEHLNPKSDLANIVFMLTLETLKAIIKVYASMNW